MYRAINMLSMTIAESAANFIRFAGTALVLQNFEVMLSASN